MQYIQAQPQQQEQLVQYRQRPVAAPLQQQPQYHFNPNPRPGSIRPLSDSSFEKELQRLVDSNKPVQFDQRPVTFQQKASPRQHHKSHQPQPSYYSESFGQPQPQPTQATRYVAPNVQKATQQAQPSQKPKFESPASKYQLVVQPTVSDEIVFKNQPHHQQQQQFYVSQYPKPTGQPNSPKLQFYTQAKEKQIHSHPRQQFQHSHHQQRPETQQQHFQEYVIPNPTHESQIYDAPSNVMKIVDAPNLQFEKPTAAQLQQAKEFQKGASRPTHIQQHQQSFLKQAETIKQSNVPSKSQIFVSQTTGSPSVTTASPSYLEQKPQQQPQYTRPEKGEKLNIPLPENRPLTQEEFQALVDAGFPVVPGL